MRPDISVHPNERRIYKSIKETIMRSTEINEKFSKRKIWAGRILTILGTIFLVFDSLGKIFGVQEAVEGTVKLGYPNQVVPIIGILLLIFSIIYIIPRTRMIGLILLTAYLGGAVATHFRIGSPLFTHILFPVYISLIIWGGFYLNEESLKNLIPIWKVK